MSRPRREGSFRFVWGWPVFLSVLTLFGLLAALISQAGVWLWLSWSALGMPLGVIIACVVRAAYGPRRM